MSDDSQAKVRIKIKNFSRKSLALVESKLHSKLFYSKLWIAAFYFTGYGTFLGNYLKL